MNRKQSFSIFIAVVVGIILVFWIGYNVAVFSNESRGFRLPPGDAEAGMRSFIELGCGNCHSVAGMDEFQRPSQYGELVVPLGGSVRVVKTYGELVTAIIHPSESIRLDIHAEYTDAEGNSIMPDYTARMTTRQLIDLVDFLQEHYEVVIPNQPTNYYPYGIDVAP